MTALKDLDPASSPRAFFGAELRRRRLEADLTQEQLGKQVCYTSSLVGLVEHALRVPTYDFAKLADEALSADGALLRLWDLVDRSALGPATRGQLADFEEDAWEIKTFGGMRVPWNVQTPAYARALLTARGNRMAAHAVQYAVETLVERQAAVAAKVTWIVLDESVLRRRVGGRDVMREQMEHLTSIADRLSVTMQVVPAEAGEYAGLDGDFTLLSLPEGWEVGYIDGYTTFSIESQAAVTSWTHAFDLIRATALPPKQSLALVESAAAAL